MKYEPKGSTLSATLQSSADGELIFRAVLETLWISNNGDWKAMLVKLKEEIGKEVNLVG